MKIGIGILSYFRLDRLKKCIDSLLENTTTPFDLFVVDNHSDPETVEYLRRLNQAGTASVGLNDRNAGWTVAKNQCLAMIQDYDIQVLMENDATCRSLVLGKDWLQLHIEAMDALGIPILQGRHSPKDHADEGIVLRVERNGFRVRLHDEILGRMVIFKREVTERVGGFWREMGMPWGAFADVEWSDRVLRAYEETTGLVFGVSLDESIFEFKEIPGSDYPDSDGVKALSRALHGPMFNERRKQTWGEDSPELFVPLRGFSGD